VQEFFESTLPGAWLTIVGGVVMVVLFIAEFSSYMSVTLTSEVRWHGRCYPACCREALGAAGDVVRDVRSCRWS
jgi:hypothetical protein